ncbi:MAG TPA: lipoprotein [Microvirga sp.]|nr:lipoprotein [Microvirga sp.]
MFPRLPLPRLVLAASLAALSLTACGRRGALESPPDPNAPKAEQSAAPADTLPSPVATPGQGGSKRGFVKTQDRFILDPLL